MKTLLVAFVLLVTAASYAAAPIVPAKLSSDAPTTVKAYWKLAEKARPKKLEAARAGVKRLQDILTQVKAGAIDPKSNGVNIFRKQWTFPSAESKQEKVTSLEAKIKEAQEKIDVDADVPISVFDVVQEINGKVEPKTFGYVVGAIGQGQQRTHSRFLKLLITTTSLPQSIVLTRRNTSPDPTALPRKRNFTTQRSRTPFGCRGSTPRISQMARWYWMGRWSKWLEPRNTKAERAGEPSCLSNHSTCPNIYRDQRPSHPPNLKDK